MKCKHGYDVDANGNHIIIPKKPSNQWSSTFPATITDYQNQVAEAEPEVKPVSFKDIERLYKKEFPEPQSQPNVNEVKKLKQLIDNAL